jgi:hypothetical protein
MLTVAAPAPTPAVAPAVVLLVVVLVVAAVVPTVAAVAAVISVCFIARSLALQASAASATLSSGSICNGNTYKVFTAILPSKIRASHVFEACNRVFEMNYSVYLSLQAHTPASPYQMLHGTTRSHSAFSRKTSQRINNEAVQYCTTVEVTFTSSPCR